MGSLKSSQLLLLMASSLLLGISKNVQIEASNDEKVNLNLYYETLCPYCQSFIVTNLIKFFDTHLNTIANLRLIPFGNAQIHGSSIICQHGEEECYLNAIEACAIHIWPDQEKHFSFIRCVENSETVEEEPESAWKGCADKFGGQKLIEDCYNGGLAKQLILGYANETNSLEPPHTYVPWVTVNKTPLYDNFDEFVSEVCKAYKGTEIPLPKICNSTEIPFKPLVSKNICKKN